MEILKGYGAPSSSTRGNKDDIYVDLTTGQNYKCLGNANPGVDLGYVIAYRFEDNTYIWESSASLDKAVDMAIRNFEAGLIGKTELAEVVLCPPTNFDLYEPDPDGYDPSTNGSAHFADNDDYGIYSTIMNELHISDKAVEIPVAVEIDGTPYETHLIQVYDDVMERWMLYIGNITLHADFFDRPFAKNTGEQFLFEIEDSSIILMMPDGGTYEIKITCTAEKVMPVDPKLLPTDTVIDSFVMRAYDDGSLWEIRLDESQESLTCTRLDET